MENVIEKLLYNIQFGNRGIKLDAIMKLKDVAKGKLDAVRQVILDAMASGDGVIQLTGAVTLARLGDESDPVVKILVGNLSPPNSENENLIKYYALEGLSYIRGRPEIVDILLKMAQYDEDASVKHRAILALSAIGNSASKNFLEYQSQRGNRSAKIGLELFGKADLDTIELIDCFGYEARRCTACGYKGKMKSTLLGKKKCPQCGKVGQNLLLWPSEKQKWERR